MSRLGDILRPDFRTKARRRPVARTPGGGPVHDGPTKLIRRGSGGKCIRSVCTVTALLSVRLESSGVIGISEEAFHSSGGAGLFYCFAVD